MAENHEEVDQTITITPWREPARFLDHQPGARGALEAEKRSYYKNLQRFRATRCCPSDWQGAANVHGGHGGSSTFVEAYGTTPVEALTNLERNFGLAFIQVHCRDGFL